MKFYSFILFNSQSEVNPSQSDQDTDSQGEDGPDRNAHFYEERHMYGEGEFFIQSLAV